jgi:MerR family transcriptional regulator, redox-sensitive transcriptional activator SoxR
VPQRNDLLTIGELASRGGIATSALRFYESIGLISSERTDAGHRRYRRHALRRVAFIRVAQGIGLTLDEIAVALAQVPLHGAPTKADWERVSRSWRGRLNDRIAELERLRDELTGCIGCGCLSLQRCSLYNSSDRAAKLGSGPRYLLGDEAPEPIQVTRRGTSRSGSFRDRR